mgnify:CR=1 FL=1
MSNSKKAAAVLLILAAILGGVSLYMRQKASQVSSEVVSNNETTPAASDTLNMSEQSTATVPEMDNSPEVDAPMNTGGSREAGIKAGAKFGYIRAVNQNAETGRVTITFDEAQMFGGDEAYAEAAKDEKCGTAQATDQCNAQGTVDLGSPFYIRNTNKQTKTYTLATNYGIIVARTPGVGFKKGSLENLAALKVQDEQNRKDWAAYDGTPFWLSFANGQVSSIEQQYLP